MFIDYIFIRIICQDRLSDAAVINDLRFFGGLSNNNLFIVHTACPLGMGCSSDS